MDRAVLLLFLTLMLVIHLALLWRLPHLWVERPL